MEEGKVLREEKGEEKKAMSINQQSEADGKRKGRGEKSHLTFTRFFELGLKSTRRPEQRRASNELVVFRHSKCGIIAARFLSLLSSTEVQSFLLSNSERLAHMSLELSQRSKRKRNRRSLEEEEV